VQHDLAGYPPLPQSLQGRAWPAPRPFVHHLGIEPAVDEQAAQALRHRGRRHDVHAPVPPNALAACTTVPLTLTLAGRFAVVPFA
jgi:hypothetical protein